MGSLFITTYKIDSLANLVPMASSSELEALKHDIDKNGQREPILLWNGKIIDGRNRQLACKTLGIDVLTKELDNNLTRDEVAKIVKSANTRRNLTETQKVISAVKHQISNSDTNTIIAKSWGISERTLKNGKYIAKYKADFIEDLYNGKSVKIVDHTKGYQITSNKITTIARLIKADLELNRIKIDNSEAVDLSFSVDGFIKTEAGKQWFYDKQKYLNITNSQMILDYIEFANLKFKLI